MPDTLNGGKLTSLQPGLTETSFVARVGRKLRNTLDVWFGPDLPMSPSAPAGTAPRTLDYPVGYNINIQPRNLEPISFDQMRSLADSFDLVRLCIETRKDQVSRMPWAFRAKNQPGLPSHAMNSGNNALAGEDNEQKDPRLTQLTDFFSYPDREHTWQQWIRLLLEDLLVLDAPVLVPIVSQEGELWSPGKSLYALEVIDGATIARKIDAMGRTPASPAVAYQQILKGLPAVDFTADQLIYRPRNVRAHKFFGFSPVEQIILTINIGLRRQLHLLNYYTEGNVPEAVAQVPKEWSADQISEFQEWFDSALAGNSARRRRITFVPECGNLQFTRDPNLKDALDEWITRIVCYAFGLSPQQFVSVMNRATAETSVEQAAAEGLVPILGYLADTINLVVNRHFGYSDIEFVWEQDRTLNALDQAKIDDIYVRAGVLSIDEVRQELGKRPIGAANAVITTRGIFPLDSNDPQ
ncbi:MAG TPA: phage portal protein [Candidatus Angelobacter sp.]|nr:phage portal protein [Candidatus Angelobacter sp.]